jgi:hypothetical protein
MASRVLSKATDALADELEHGVCHALSVGARPPGSGFDVPLASTRSDAIDNHVIITP